MANRKSISKKLRFEIFKRDGFICQYCGVTPPTVVLEIDHIIPVVNGGTNDPDNLTTACFDCNRGKGPNELSCAPQTTAEKAAQMKEKEEQYIEYKKLVSKIQSRINIEIDAVDEIYSRFFPEYCLSDRFKSGSLKNFLEKIGYPEVSKAMEIACTRIYDENKVIKYFCGICWNYLRERDNNG